MALSFPPFGLWPLAFVALIPLGVKVCAPGASRSEAVAGGLWFGALFYGVALYWVPFTVNGILSFGAVLGCLAIAVLAGTSGLQLLAVHRLVAGQASLAFLALPAVWVTTETAMAYAGPLAMPWTPLGLALAGTPALAGLAGWGGVRGLSLWIALVNGGLVGCILVRSGWGRRVGVVGTLAALIGPAAGAIAADQRLETTHLPPILATQIDIPRELLRDPDLRDRHVGDALRRVLGSWISSNRSRPGTRSTPRESKEPVLVLLPEAPFREEWNQELEGQIVTLAGGWGIPVLVGARMGDGPRSDPHRSRNAIVLVEPGGGTRLVHEKIRLVPGVESPAPRPGLRTGPLQLSGLNVGFAICFESAFGRDASRARRDGANVLFNPTNDGWFSPTLPGIGSPALAQHRAHLILRATESRMTAVRSSLGGELLAIAPDGRVQVRRRVGEEGAALVVPSVGPLTPYVRHGDTGGIAGALLLVILAVLRVRSERRSATESVPSGAYEGPG